MVMVNSSKSRFVVGIRHKESGLLRGLVVCDDPQFVINDIRASIKGTPNCAYAMFSSDYEIIVKEISCDKVDYCIALGE